MITVQDLRPIALFDGLNDDQLQQLLNAGTTVTIEPGQEFFHEGDSATFWWVVVEGAISLFRHVGREEVRVGIMDQPGRWAGGFVAWDEHGVCLATGVGSAPGRLLRVPAGALADLLQLWFPFGVHLLAGVSGTARAIEATARQRESLVRLGTIAAGLAHELNNPAAAAIRTVSALEETRETEFKALAALIAVQISGPEFVALDELRSNLKIPNAEALPTDPLALADLEEDLAAWMRARNIEKPDQCAAQLVMAGIGLDLCEAIEAVVPAEALSPALTWLIQTLTAQSLLDQLADSTRAISALVSATRSYTQMDRGSIQRVDVTEGIESTLTMLSSKLTGISVVREYASDRPQIEAFAGELNQVWTNLIDNSVDAMSGSGTLRLAVRGDDAQGVVVEIIDSGTGMPPEVAERAFEAFYTTKEVGSGTGLGLDIAHRIIAERHGGTIDIASHPGQTIMRAGLPGEVES